MGRLVFAAAGLLGGCGLALNGLGPAGDGSPDAGGVALGHVDASSPGSTGGTTQGPGDAAPDATASPTSDASPDAAVGAAVNAAAGVNAAVSAGDALQFTNGAYVNMGPLPIPADFTIEAWVNPAGTSGETDVVAQDKDGQSAGQFRFGITSGNLFFMMSDASGDTYGLYAAAYALQTTQSLPVGTWSHVAVTKSGADFALFIGATQAATFTATSSFAYGGPAVSFRIAARVGSDGTSADSAFSGVIDEVRFWNVARSASQIAASISTTVTPADSMLLAYWRFDDGSGLTASDEEGKYPGTLVAGPVWIVSTAF